MKRLIYQVRLGAEKNSKLYKFCIGSVKEYCRNHNIDHYEQTSPMLWITPDPFNTNRNPESYKKHGGYLPIFEKENAFKYLQQYDQIAIIDSDVFIREDAPNIFDEINADTAFAAASERKQPLTEKYKEKLRLYSNMQFMNLRDVDWNWNNDGADFYNMGVMVITKKLIPYLRGESPKQFIERYEFKNFVDGVGNYKRSTDQVLLNYWIKRDKIPFQELPWQYNGLFSANKKIDTCNFVHFFLKDKLPHKGEDVASLVQML